ncbi:molybdopterin cofactor-binding domain-containing protein [Thalassotalea sp. PLHSN55]|uniref:xanthine dehydrogenase family protein molybdopterin-binding subunit n=1 Tax=Thalassotalea sp. PLHSN55 TaxID=3435888 RepID=UPI003F83F8F8
MNNKKINNVSRRKFLKGLGISSSALVLSINLPQLSLLPKAIAQTVPAEKFSPSVYLEINHDNSVAVIVHRSEMGQGIRTSIPMVVADELEANWQQIKVIQGLGDKKYGSQNTDGSRSIRDFYQPLREAGATAKLMLEQAAAQLWQVPVKECQAKAGNIHHIPSEKIVSFGELVDIAAKLPLPDKSTLTLKNKEDYNFIGNKNIKLVDNYDIATGKAVYGFDVERENMLYAVIARPPVLASTVKSFDATKALAVKGVKHVIKLDDIKEPVAFKALGGIAVIATNTWAATKGRELLDIQWQVNERHSQYQSSDYKAALQLSCEKPKKTLREKGDVHLNLTNAKKVLTADYYVPALIHSPMEPPAATADYQDGKIEIWACTQTPQSAQNVVAKTLDIAPENVSVNVTLLGGGFGRKSKPDFVVEAAVLSKKLNLPIKVLWTREDEIKNGYYHAISYQKLTAGIDDNNNVNAWHHTSATQPIGATFNTKAKLIGSEASLGMIDMPFDIGAIKCDVAEAPAHTRIGWLRSVTNINHAFAISSFVDEIAYQRKLDPVDNLLQLLGKDRNVNPNKDNAKYGNYGESLDEYPIDIARFKNVIKTVKQQANYQDNPGKGKGFGIAVHRSFTSYVASIVEVSSNELGKISIDNIFIAADCGTIVNPERVISQMEGAAIFALSLTLYGEVTATDGVIDQGNFDDYPLVRIGEVPTIDVAIINSDAPPGGVGEPGVPPIAPAICNAIFAATGKRYRELPLAKQGII